MNTEKMTVIRVCYYEDEPFCSRWEERGFGRLVYIIREANGNVLMCNRDPFPSDAVAVPPALLEKLPDFPKGSGHTFFIQEKEIIFPWQRSYASEEERCQAAVEEFYARHEHKVLPVIAFDKGDWMYIHSAEMAECCPSRMKVNKYDSLHYYNQWKHLLTAKHVCTLFRCDRKVFQRLFDQRQALKALANLGGV